MVDFNLDGFANEGVITSGLTAPIALTFLPDNRMLLLEKGGQIFIADPNSGQKSLYLDISNIVNSGQERGLLEIAIPPDFDPDAASGNNEIYLFYTRSGNTNRAVIASYKHMENSGGLSSAARRNSETILWTDTDEYVSCCHYGGGLDFGPDGKLWLTSSDKFNTSNGGEGGPDDDWPLNLENTSGKIIRINRDGSIPDGTDGWPANPYADGTIEGPYPTLAEDGKPYQPHPSIWGYGVRNPFRASWDHEYGKFYIGEVGGNRNRSTDDLHVSSLEQPGAFYGWNFYEGVDSFVAYNRDKSPFNPSQFPQPDTDLADPSTGDYFSAPIFDIPHSSFTGGFVYRGDMFPEEFDGVYFFGNFEDGYIKFLDLNDTGDEVIGNAYDFKPSGSLSGNASNVVFLEEGIDGALYYINYEANGGQVQRITFGTNGNMAPFIISSNVTDDQGDPDDQAGDTVPLGITYNATVGDNDTQLGNLTYRINFGDGTIVNGSPNPNTGEISVNHQYTATGTYNATLRVRDGSNTTFAETITITAGSFNSAPTFQSVSSDLGFVDPGDQVTFTAVVADANDPVNTLTYTLDFGDGSQTSGTPNNNGTIEVTHTYADDGIYNAFFTISDGEADPVSSDNLPIRVGDSSQLPVTNGLVFQVEAFTKIGLDGTTVTEWIDQSGFGNSVMAAGNPQFIDEATPSGQPAVAFDGNGDYIFRDATLQGFSSGNGPRTMFFVVDYEDVTNGEYAGLVYGKADKNQAFGLTLDGNDDDFTVQGWGKGNDRRTDVDGVINPENGQQRGFVSHAVVFDGTTYRHFVDGAEIDSGNKTYNTVLEKLLIGQNLDGGETPMSVAAAYIYNRALNANEFGAVENYIQQTFLASPSSNNLPMAVNDPDGGNAALFTTNEDTAFTTGNVLNNDSDIDGDSLSVSGVDTTITIGEVTNNGDGTFDYDPNGQFEQLDGGETATDSFSYTISDGNGGEATATVTVTINGADEAGANPLPVTNGLVAQFESNTNVIEGNGVVTGWLDRSGSGNNLLASGNPQLVDGATPTGQSAVVLDGNGDYLFRDTTLQGFSSGNGPRTMFFVVDYEDVTNKEYAGLVYGKAAKNQAFGLTLDGNDDDFTVQGWGGNNDRRTDIDGVIDPNTGQQRGFVSHAVVFDGTTFKHYVNGTEIDSGNKTYNTALEKLLIGQNLNGGETPMSVAAAYIYNRALNTNEFNTVENYIQQTYLASSNGGGNQSDGRVTDSLLALYTFDEGSGQTVRDTSGAGNALDLSIDDLTGVTWGNGSLTLNDPTLITTNESPTKLFDGLTGGNLTIEAWVTPENTAQTGPARIVTFSNDTRRRNFTLGQAGEKFDVRLRTTATSSNGRPSVASPSGSVDADLTHVIYTRTAGGDASIYVDGELVTTDTVGGNLSNWASTHQFALGNELGASERPWLGTLDLVAIYNQSFDENEVAQNFLAGPNPTVI